MDNTSTLLTIGLLAVIVVVIAHSLSASGKG